MAPNFDYDAFQCGEFDGGSSFISKESEFPATSRSRDYYRLGYELGKFQAHCKDKVEGIERLAMVLSFLSLLGILLALFGYTWRGGIGIILIGLSGLVILLLGIKTALTIEMLRKAALDRWSKDRHIGAIGSFVDAHCFVHDMGAILCGEPTLQPLHLWRRRYYHRYGLIWLLSGLLAIAFSATVLSRSWMGLDPILYNFIGRELLGW